MVVSDQVLGLMGSSPLDILRHVHAGRVCVPGLDGILAVPPYFGERVAEHKLLKSPFSANQ